MVDIGKYLPAEVTEINSGGAKGVDSCVRKYAVEHGIKLTEFLPDYRRYGRAAPLKRNLTILENAELVVAFWNGQSRGTKFVIDNAKRMGVEVKVLLMKSIL